MKGKGLITTMSVAICLVLVLVGLPSQTPAQQREETIPFGVIQPLTGPGAPWGTSCLRGAEMAAEEINRKGVVVKGVTYKIKIIGEDDKYLPDRAVDRLRKLIEKDKIRAVYGSTGSASSMAEAPICNANKVLHFTCSFDTNIIRAGNDYSFMTSCTPVSYAQGLVAFLAQLIPDTRSVGLIYVDDATGQIALKAYEPEVKKKGWRTRIEGYQRGVVEFGPLCANIAAAKPDQVFFLGVPPGDAHKICKGLRELGYKGPLSTTSAFVLPELYNMLGDNIGTTLQVSGVGEKPYAANDDYIAFYSECIKRYGKSAWTSKEGVGYSYVKIYTQAIERAQTVDSTAIRDLLATPDKEWYFLYGGKCYTVNDKIVGELRLPSRRYFNMAWQIGSWDNVAKKVANVGWIYPYGWRGGELPK